MSKAPSFSLGSSCNMDVSRLDISGKNKLSWHISDFESRRQNTVSLAFDGNLYESIVAPSKYFKEEFPFLVRIIL